MEKFPDLEQSLSGEHAAASESTHPSRISKLPGRLFGWPGTGETPEVKKPLLEEHRRANETPHGSHLSQPGKASGSPDHPEGEFNGKSNGNGNWKCQNAEGCGLADTSSFAAQEERSQATKKLTRAVCFCVVFMIVEIVGGIKAGSLAVLTDAVHLSSDVASFAISLFAVWAGGWEADHRHTFGFYRAEVLGALISILIIWLVTGSIVYEAINRLFTHQAPINGPLMFIVASLGLLVNLVMMLLLGHGHGHDHGHGHAPGHEHSGSHGQSHSHEHGGDHSHDHVDHQHHHDEESSLVTPEEHPSHMVDPKSFDLDQHRQECRRRNLVVRESQEIIVCICDEEERTFERRLTTDSTSIEHDPKCSGSSKARENVNVKSAYLHVLGDLVQSVGVMIGGAVIWWKPEWKIVDLICTLLFSVVVLWTTLKMVRDVLAVLMESTPREIDAKALQAGMETITGVEAVHELHIWAITLGKVILACHVTINHDASSDEVLQKVVHYCDSKFKISHVTIQIERGKKVELDSSQLTVTAHDHDHDEH